MAGKVTLFRSGSCRPWRDELKCAASDYRTARLLQRSKVSCLHALNFTARSVSHLPGAACATRRFTTATLDLWWTLSLTKAGSRRQF